MKKKSRAEIDGKNKITREFDLVINGSHVAELTWVLRDDDDKLLSHFQHFTEE